MCRENKDHLHLLGSAGAHFDDTSDRGCPHDPLPLGVKLHDLLLSLNQPCIHPHPSNPTIEGNAANVVGHHEDIVDVMDADEEGRELGEKILPPASF